MSVKEKIKSTVMSKAIKTGKKIAVKQAKKMAKNTAIKQVKKAFVTFITSTLVFAMAMMASADVLWEPGDNSYYMKHRSQCEQYIRLYEVPEGSSAIMYESPESDKQVVTLQAGEGMMTSHKIEIGGETWAVGYRTITNDESGIMYEGWVRLARLQMVYDNTLFMNDYQDQFTEYQGELDSSYKPKEAFYTWSYPGSGQIERDFQPEEFEDVNIQHVYTGPDGGKWGFIAYLRGKASWIYLDDPESFNTPIYPMKIENTVTDTGEEKAPAANSSWASSGIISTVCLVAAVVLFSIALLGRKKRTQGSGSAGPA